MRHNNVFTHHRTKLMRSHIPRGENLSVALIFIGLIAVAAWVITTRDNFDPGERDLAVELLGDNSLQIDIYHRPLKPWVEPGQQLAAAAFDLGPFPAATLDSDWQPVGRVRRFQADNLYEKINGEAEKFIKQGFVELAFLRVRSASDGSEIAIELFDQGDLGGSLGIFSDHTGGQSIDNRDGVSFVSTGAGAIGRNGRYFFRIAGDRSGQAISDKTTSLIAAFAQLGGAPAAVTVQQETLPAGFLLLRRRLGIAETDIQFEESNVFQYDFAQDFWFGKADLGGDARMFIHSADSADAAGDLIGAVLEEHSYEYDQLESAGDHVLLRHRYLGTYFAIMRRGSHVYGIEKSPGTAGMSALLGRIGKELDDEES